MNKKSALSFFILLGAFAALVIGFVLGRTPGAEGIAGLLFLGVICAVIWSLALAVIGLIECVKHPERYPRGKAVAGLTLVLVFALFLIPVIASGVRGVMTGAKARSQIRQSGAQPLRFDELSFVFRPPALPWNQTDARRFRGPVLAFTRADQMFFTVSANRLQPGFFDARSRLVEMCKASTRRDATSYRLVKEGEVTRNGIAGWQTETQAAFQGHEYYLVHWILAANGFGYQLVTWGPPALSSQVKEEAERLFSNFELKAHKD